MAVPTRGRGLSRAVFQAPDLIGQAQRQQQIDQRDRALELQEQQFKAKQAAASKVDPFKLDDGDIAKFPTYYSDLGSDVSSTINQYIQENGTDLVREREIGFGQKLNKLNRFIAQAKALKKVTDKYQETYLNDSKKTEGINRGRYQQYSGDIRNLLSNVQVTMAEDGSAQVIGPDGQPIPVNEFMDEINPRNYYAEQETFYDAMVSRFPTKQLNNQNLNTRVSTFITDVKTKPNLLGTLTADFFREEVGYGDKPIPENLAATLMSGESFNGYELSDVLEYGKQLVRNFYKTKISEEGRGNINIFDYVQDANLVPFTKQGLKQVSPQLGVALPKWVDLKGISIPRNRQARIEVPLEVKRGGEKVMEDFQGQITSVFKNAEGNYTGLIYVPERNVYRSVDLNDNDLGRVRQEMRLPTNITLDQVIENVNQGNQPRPQERPSEQEQQPEETQTEKVRKPTQQAGSETESEIIENPTREQYESLPPGATYIYDGVEYTKEGSGESKKKNNTEEVEPVTNNVEEISTTPDNVEEIEKEVEEIPVANNEKEIKEVVKDEEGKVDISQMPKIPKPVFGPSKPKEPDFSGMPKIERPTLGPERPEPKNINIPKIPVIKRISNNLAVKDSSGNNIQTDKDFLILHQTGSEFSDSLLDGTKIESADGNDFYTGAHYYVAKNGKIYQTADEKDVVYHAGKSKINDEGKVNERSVGVEIVSKPKKDGSDEAGYYESLTKNQIDQTAKLVVDWAKRKGLTKDQIESRVFGHHEITTYNPNWRNLPKDSLDRYKGVSSGRKVRRMGPRMAGTARKVDVDIQTKKQILDRAKELW